MEIPWNGKSKTLVTGLLYEGKVLSNWINFILNMCMHATEGYLGVGLVSEEVAASETVRPLHKLGSRIDTLKSILVLTLSMPVIY